MSNQRKYFDILKPIAGFAIISFMIWYFSDLVGYIIAATFISMIGQPLVKRIDKIKLGKKQILHSVSVGITLFVILFIVSLFILVVVPLIIQQANVIASINLDAVAGYFRKSLDSFYQFLVQYGVVNPGDSLTTYFQQQLTELVDLTKFTNIFASFVGATGSVVMGIFIILFLTFYLMADDSLVKNFLLMLTPEKHVKNMSSVLSDSKILLIRYFHGILIEVGIMMTLETVGLLILGVPNAILIGFLGGLMNIIPYLGPLIGASLGVILADLSVLGMGQYDSLLATSFFVILTFASANLVDNFVLQPQIYSKSVKAHPVEVFLVIIMGGKLAGVVGMILAIPLYTVIKVVARQFMDHMKLVKFLTARM